MSLKEYAKKRDLKESGEPAAIIRKGEKKKIYVIHKHQASHLHWDLRLEMRGVLKSWAIPKEPPRSKHIKRLAIEVEDHPVGYANFEGQIKEGYGKGMVRIWDKGTFKITEIDDKKIVFELTGKRLSGKYCLVKTNYGEKGKSWLFMRI